MPILQIHILKGRSLDQKRALAKSVTSAVTESLNCNADQVRIIIYEMEHEDFATAGVLASDKEK